MPGRKKEASCKWWECNQHGHDGEQCGNPLETEHRATLKSGNLTPGTYPQKANLKRYTCLNAQISTIYNSQDIKAI